MQNNQWNKTSKFTDSKESPGFLLWKTQITWKRMIEKSLYAHDLTHAQFVILASTVYLTRDGEQVTQVELAKHASCDINTTSQILRSLEKKGLIRRLSIEGNEKSKYPVLTEFGYTIFKPAIKTVENVDTEFFSNLTAEEVDKFKLTLLKLI